MRDKCVFACLLYLDENYTALIPYDDAFREWYPVDWGFNPFEVESFVRETILDHIVKGTFDKDTVADGQKFRTLGGKEIAITKGADGKLKANGEANVVSAENWGKLAHSPEARDADMHARSTL